MSREGVHHQNGVGLVLAQRRQEHLVEKGGEHIRAISMLMAARMPSVPSTPKTVSRVQWLQGDAQQQDQGAIASISARPILPGLGQRGLVALRAP